MEEYGYEIVRIWKIEAMEEGGRGCYMGYRRGRQ
jgi:hypothetical protein